MVELHQMGRINCHVCDKKKVFLVKSPRIWGIHLFDFYSTYQASHNTLIECDFYIWHGVC